MAFHGFAVVPLSNIAIELNSEESFPVPENISVGVALSGSFITSFLLTQFTSALFEVESLSFR